MAHLDHLSQIDASTAPSFFGGADIITGSGEYYTLDTSAGYATLGITIKPPVNISGAYVPVYFEGSHCGTVWEQFTVRNTTEDELTQKADTWSQFLGSVVTFKYIRFRVDDDYVTPGGAFGSLIQHASVVETIEFNAPPHKFGYAPVRKMFSATTAQTNAIIWTPADGKKFVITGLSVVAAGANDGRITIFEETNSNGNRFFNGYIQVENKGSFIWNWPSITAQPADNADTSLKVTTTSAITCDIMAFGYEI